MLAPRAGPMASGAEFSQLAKTHLKPLSAFLCRFMLDITSGSWYALFRITNHTNHEEAGNENHNHLSTNHDISSQWKATWSGLYEYGQTVQEAIGKLLFSEPETIEKVAGITFLIVKETSK